MCDSTTVQQIGLNAVMTDSSETVQNGSVQETQSADRNHTTLQLATVEQPPQMHDTDSRQHNALALKLSGSARLYVPVNELVLETGCQRIGPAILINGDVNLCAHCGCPTIWIKDE